METPTELQELSMTEQSLQQLLMQKQQFQTKLIEIESALGEIDKTDVVYKIIGNIMVSSKKEDVKSDLEQKKEITQLRIKSIEKQETALKEKAKKLQEKALGKLKEGEQSSQK